MSAAPHHRKADHVSLHAMPVVDNSNLSWLLVGPVVSEQHVDPTGAGLNGVVVEFRQGIGVALISEISDAAHECVADGQSKFEPFHLLRGDIGVLCLKV